MPIRKIWKTATFGALAFLLAAICAVFAYSVILYWQSRFFLSTVKMIQIGSVLNAGTIDTAKKMKALVFVGSPQTSSASYQYFYVDPSALANSRFSNEFKPSSFDQCISDSCAISFPASGLQVDRVSQHLAHYPRTLLAAFYWIYRFQKLHRWLPIAWLDPVTIRVEKGVVTEFNIRMRSEAIDGPSCPRAEAHIRVADATTPSWEVTPTKMIRTGGDCAEDVGVQVHATTDATRGQLDDAIDFNLHCLLPGGYCTECDMLPNICHKYVKRNPPNSVVDVPIELTCPPSSRTS